MATASTERALAIEVCADVVRGLVLVAGHPATVGGFVQVEVPALRSTAGLAARIAAALDCDRQLPVVVVLGDRSTDVQAGEAVVSLQAAGSGPVRVATLDDAVARALDANSDESASLRDCSISQSLLDSYDGLTLRALAPVAGGALLALELHSDTSSDTGRQQSAATSQVLDMVPEPTPPTAATGAAVTGAAVTNAPGTSDAAEEDLGPEPAGQTRGIPPGKPPPDRNPATQPANTAATPLQPAVRAVGDTHGATVAKADELATANTQDGVPEQRMGGSALRRLCIAAVCLAMVVAFVLVLNRCGDAPPQPGDDSAGSLTELSVPGDGEESAG